MDKNESIDTASEPVTTQDDEEFSDMGVLYEAPEGKKKKS